MAHTRKTTPKVDRALQRLQRHSLRVETWRSWLEKRFQFNLTWLAEHSSNPTDLAWMIQSWLPKGKIITALHQGAD